MVQDTRIQMAMPQVPGTLDMLPCIALLGNTATVVAIHIRRQPVTIPTRDETAVFKFPGLPFKNR